MKRRWTASLCFAACLVAAAAGAQQRPLLTEDPEPIGTGRVLIEGGVDLALSQKYPASGLEGTLWRVPMLGVSIGLSPNAELQFDGSLFDHLSIDERHPAPLGGLPAGASEDRVVEIVGLVGPVGEVDEGGSQLIFSAHDCPPRFR